MADENTGPETAQEPRSHAGRFKPRKQPEPAPQVESEAAPEVKPTPAPAAPVLQDDGVAFPGAVTIAPNAIKIPPRPVLVEYHVGTRRTCPHQNVTIGGISFPQFTGGALIGENRRQGARVKLSAAQIELVKTQLGQKVVRWVTAGDGTRRGQVLSVKSPGFQAEVGDEPLAAHVYCYPVPPAQKVAEEREPASMLG